MSLESRPLLGEEGLLVMGSSSSSLDIPSRRGEVSTLELLEIASLFAINVCIFMYVPYGEVLSFLLGQVVMDDL